MRRALFALLLVCPVAALGQTITFDSNTINIVQCNGVQNTDAGTSDNLNLGLTWTVQPTTSVTFSSGGSYKVYVANQQLTAGVSTTYPASVSCTTANSTTSPFLVQQVGNSTYDASTQTVSSVQEISMSSIVSALSTVGYSCAVTSATQTIYLCVQWFDSTGAVNGYALGNVTLSLSQPTAPTIGTVNPGDGSLYVDYSDSDSSVTNFKVRAVPTAGTDLTPIFSGESTSTSQIQVSGLTNGQEYQVQVYAFNAANNPSVASAAATGVPEPTDDFWTLYKLDGGKDSGGCSTAAGAVGIFGALSLLALRRRKP